MMSIDVLITISCLFLAPLSILTSGVLIWSHLRVRKLRKYPGEFVLLQCSMQLILDCTWFLAFYEIKGFERTLNAVFTWACFCSSNYAFILSFEIYSKIKRPFRSTTKPRRIVYHALSLGIPSVYVFLFIMIGVEYHIRNLVSVFMLFPVFMSSVLAVHSFCKLKGQNAANYMFYHSLVVVVFSVVLILIIIINFIEIIGHKLPTWLVEIYWVLGSSSGLTIFVARVSEPKMLKQIVRCILCRTDVQSETLTKSREFIKAS